MTGANLETIINELPVFVENGALYDLVAAVSIIVKEGVTDMLHMDANLVCSAGFQHALDERHIPEPFEDLVMGDSLLAVFAFRISVE